MVYITLDELKEILPEILDQWIDEDDESWEWIFQEIEQNCHIGKKFKSKKWKKKLRDDVDELTRKVDVITPKLIADLNSRVDELRKYATDNLSSRINRLSNDVEAAKSMAQTAKQRTDVDYTKCSKEKSDADVAQKEIPVVKKMCATCRYSSNMDGSPKSFDAPPCYECNGNDKWEVKDDDNIE